MDPETQKIADTFFWMWSDQDEDDIIEITKKLTKEQLLEIVDVYLKSFNKKKTNFNKDKIKSGNIYEKLYDKIIELLTTKVYEHIGGDNKVHTCEATIEHKNSSKCGNVCGRKPFIYKDGKWLCGYHKNYSGVKK